jgi:phosphoribosylamine--glycine ligase
MGAVSPVIFADAVFMKKVEEKVIKPTIAGLHREKIPYKGFIFIGLMNVNGEPYVIEYNARLGDPETQVIMPRIKNDFVELLVAAARGELREKQVQQENLFAVTVSLVSGGYPGDYQKGKLISGIKKNGKVLIFHAGTKDQGGNVLTDGGRVLAVTGRGADIMEASKNAYEGISGIHWDGLYFRTDIGLDLQRWRG